MFRVFCHLKGTIVGFNYEICKIYDFKNDRYRLQRLNQETKKDLVGDFYTNVTDNDLKLWCICGTTVVLKKDGDLVSENVNGSTRIIESHSILCRACT